MDSTDDIALLALAHQKSASRKFKKLGQGWSRTAYLHKKSGVVYKVTVRPAARYNEQSINEGSNIVKFKSKPLKFWDFPDFKLHTVQFDGFERVVIAMTYIPKEPMPKTWSLDFKKAVRHFGLYDMHTGNVHYSGGIYYIIDVAA